MKRPTSAAEELPSPVSSDDAEGDVADNASPSKDNQLRSLAAETHHLEAGVSMEEAAVLLAESKMASLGARLAKARARAIELGLARPKVLGVEERSGLAVEPEPSSTSVSRHESRPSGPQDYLPDDAFIDQTNERLPSRRLYLQLARDGAFLSTKVGKKIIARWGDVKAAFSVHRSPKKLPSPGDDGLDGLRRNVGLQPKGRG